MVSIFTTYRAAGTSGERDMRQYKNITKAKIRVFCVISGRKVWDTVRRGLVGENRDTHKVRERKTDRGWESLGVAFVFSRSRG